MNTGAILNWKSVFSVYITLAALASSLTVICLVYLLKIVNLKCE